MKILLALILGALPLYCGIVRANHHRRAVNELDLMVRFIARAERLIGYGAHSFDEIIRRITDDKKFDLLCLSKLTPGLNYDERRSALSIIAENYAAPKEAAENFCEFLSALGLSGREDTIKMCNEYSARLAGIHKSLKSDLSQTVRLCIVIGAAAGCATAIIFI